MIAPLEDAENTGHSLTMLECIAAVCGVALKLHAEKKSNFDGEVALVRVNHVRRNKRAAMNVRENRKRKDDSGSIFDGFLQQEEILKEVEAAVIKRVLAWQLERAMQEKQESKRAYAAPA